MNMLSDKNTDFIDPKAMQNFSGFYPDGFSMKCIEHYRQIHLSGRFCKYDYGSPEANFDKYGQNSPPDYDKSAIKNHNFLLICGEGDLICSPHDYYNLKELLVSNGNTVEF